jgi:hypothetical protein
VSSRSSISLPYRKGWATFPAWLSYVLVIAFFSIAWAALRVFFGLGVLNTLLVLMVPFAWLIWRGDPLRS